MIARRIVIRGSVLGVGYREAMVDAATRAGVTGWVRNRRDRSVEALLQGSPQAVATLTEWAWEGPAYARVSGIDIEDAPPVPLAGFVRVPTV
jgi:acylphosphatase